MIPLSISKSQRTQVVTLFIVIIAAAVVVLPQKNRETPSATPVSSPTPVIKADDMSHKLDEISSAQRELTQRLENKDKEISELKGKLEFTNILIGGSAGFLALFLLFGAGFSVFGWFKSETRAREAHSFALRVSEETEKRTARLFDFAIEGETASRERAATVHQNFLAGSKETLDLVNATLNLAKEASERAAKFIERKARATIVELDELSQSMLRSVSPQDIRQLVEDPSNRSDLRSLAHRITGFEINQFVLPEDIQLTPACLFIKGMDFHLSQQFKDAILNWKKVALAPDTPEGLKSLAWYWLGYEQNNLGEFNEAELCFRNALDHAEGIRKYELNRILYETRFFNKEKYQPETLIDNLESLLAALDKEPPTDEPEKQRISVVNTLANVINQSGRKCQKSGNVGEAKKHFARARDFYEQVAETDKWAAFGLAEMLYELDDDKNAAQRIFRDRVRTEAINVAVQREEPRSKVLARTTELICCIRVPEWDDEVPSLMSLVLQDLGRVDSRLTVYSQIQRRNVPKREFKSELDELSRLRAIASK